MPWQFFRFPAVDVQNLLPIYYKSIIKNVNITVKNSMDTIIFDQMCQCFFRIACVDSYNFNIFIQNRLTKHHSSNRSEEHTSELQSRFELVCRLLLEKKNHKLVHHPVIKSTINKKN